MEFIQLVRNPDDGISPIDAYKFGILESGRAPQGYDYYRYIFKKSPSGGWWVFPHNKQFTLKLIF